ncbi:hypothetical protein GCM10009585_03900 [Brevibacterium paucivorans]|uniref:YhdT family protein n=1 Tax=Brevibacterium paucivorans TaxID=170994 RepID=UPI0031CDCD6F
MSESIKRTQDQSLGFEEDPRYRVAGRESLLCVGYWTAFTVGAVVIAWALGHRDATEIEFIMGFPDWFFWSAIVFTGFMSVIVPFLLVKFGFTDMDLEPEPRTGLGAEKEVQP